MSFPPDSSFPSPNTTAPGHPDEPLGHGPEQSPGDGGGDSGKAPLSEADSKSEGRNESKPVKNVVEPLSKQNSQHLQEEMN